MSGSERRGHFFLARQGTRVMRFEVLGHSFTNDNQFLQLIMNAYQQLENYHP